MVDVDRIGGVPVVMRELLEAGLLHGDCLTVTGRTMAENLAALDPPAPDGEVDPPAVASDPRRRRHRHPDAAPWPPRGRWSRWPGIDQRPFRGHGPGVRRRGRGHGGHPGRLASSRARCVVIRYEGPKGGPGMREMLAVTGAMKGAGRGADCALVTDGRFSRRHPRLLRRPRGPRGGRRRPHRLRGRRRPDRHRRRRRAASTCWSTRAELARRGRRVEGRPSPATPPACWPSTPGW